MRAQQGGARCATSVLGLGKGEIQMSTNKNETKSNEGLVIAGLQKYYPAGGNLTLKGKVLAIPVLIQLLTDHIGAVGTTASAKGGWKLAVVDERAKAAVLRPLLKALRLLVLNQF